MDEPDNVEAPLAFNDVELVEGLEDYQKVYVVCRNFIEYTQGREWYPSQRKLALRIIKSLVKNEGEELVCEMTRQFGKSQLIGDLVYSMMVMFPRMGYFPNGFKVGCFGPKKEQAELIYRKIKENLDNRRQQNIDMLTSLGVSVSIANGRRIVLNVGTAQSFAICESASDNASIEGLTLDFAVLDESQEISEIKILKSIYPMTAATNGTKILIGTPNFNIGYLFKAVQRHIGKDTCVIVPYDIALKEKYYLYLKTKEKFHLQYKRFIYKMKRQMGEDSDAFRTQFKLEWITERTRAITADKLESLAEVEIEPGVFKSYGPILASDHPVFVGIDLAKVVDATVVTVTSHFSPIDGKEYPNRSFIYNWLYLQGDNFEDQKEYIKSFLSSYSNIGSTGPLARSVICWDDTGIGIPVGDWLKRNFRCQMIGLRLNAQYNSDMYSLTLQELNNSRVHYPIESDTKELRQFIKEWIGLEKEYKGNLLKCESDPDDKYAHDDFCDSLCFALYAMYQPGSSRYMYVGALNELLDPKRQKDGQVSKDGQGKEPAGRATEREAWDRLDLGRDSWYDSPNDAELYGRTNRKRPGGLGDEQSLL